MKLQATLFLVMFTVLINGCSVLAPVKTPVISKYIVNAKPRVMRKHADNTIAIMVMRPETKSVFDTTKMFYTDSAHHVKSYSVTQWAKTPSQMLQPLIMQSLSASDYFHAVIAPPVVGKSNYVLNTQIFDFEQDLSRKSARFCLSVHAQITQLPSNKIIAAKSFNITQPMMRHDPYHGVLAANRAARNMLSALVRFTINAVERSDQE